MKFGVDSPADSFLSRGHGPSGDAALLEIFNEQRPESSHSLQFNSDRQVAVELLGPDAAGEMKVAAAVGDFAKDVDAHGLENVAARVHAELLRDRQVKDEDTVRVIIDGRPPRFELALASDRVIKVADIHVDLHEVITLSDLRKFDYGIEGGKMKTVGKHAPLGLIRDTDQGPRSGRIHRAGRRREQGRQLRLPHGQGASRRAAAAPGDEAGPSATITVRGTVRWLDGSPAAGVDVAIENPARPQRPTPTGDSRSATCPAGPTRSRPRARPAASAPWARPGTTPPAPTRPKCRSNYGTNAVTSRSLRKGPSPPRRCSSKERGSRPAPAPACIPSAECRASACTAHAARRRA